MSGLSGSDDVKHQPSSHQQTARIGLAQASLQGSAVSTSNTVTPTYLLQVLAAAGLFALAVSVVCLAAVAAASVAAVLCCLELLRASCWLWLVVCPAAYAFHPPWLQPRVHSKL